MRFFIFKVTYYRGNGELYIGGIKSHKYNDNRCIADIGNKETVPGLYNCKEAMQKGMGIYWDFSQVLHNHIITGWRSLGGPIQFNILSVVMTWGFISTADTCSLFQGSELKNRQTKRCLEIKNKVLLIQECSGQRWEIQNIIKPF